jgi:hypothetical protein
LNIARPAAQEDYLKACIVVEMCMKRRDHHFVMFMLKVGEFLGEKPCVMVVDQSDASHDGSLRCHNRRSDKPVPDQVAERFGAALVAFFSDKFVKPIE